MGAAQVGDAPLTPDIVGRLYATALRAEGVRDKGTKLTPQQMIQAFSNVMGCFAAPPKA